jgi:signal peptidase I
MDDQSPVRARKKTFFARLLRVGYEFLRSIALVLMTFFLVRSFLVEAFKIPTSSMEGTHLAGDFLLVNKAVYGSDIPGTHLSIPAFARPDLGEIIVFHPPHDLSKYYVKRLVGMPGDTLHMTAKTLFRNGVELEEPYVRHQDPNGDAFHPQMDWQNGHLSEDRRARRYRPTRDNWGPIIVPTDRYFVLGDNRDNSEDSRYWGFVDPQQVTGRPWFVYYSVDLEEDGRFSWLRYIRWDRIGGIIR